APAADRGQRQHPDARRVRVDQPATIEGAGAGRLSRVERRAATAERLGGPALGRHPRPVRIDLRGAVPGAPGQGCRGGAPGRDDRRFDQQEHARIPHGVAARAGPVTRRWLVALVMAAATRPLVAQRPTGAIGAYVPPRAWPQEPRRFDLLHQTMRLRFDIPHRTLLGEVTTRLAITLAPTDTIRLDAENLTIDRATDARGRPLRYSADTSHVTVRLARRAAVGDTVEFTLAYHGVPERGLYFVPRRNVIWSQGEATETRAWIPTYDASNDKTTWDFFVTADSGMVVLSNGRLIDVTPVKAGGRGPDVGQRAPSGQRVWHWTQARPASTYLYSVPPRP